MCSSDLATAPPLRVSAADGWIDMLLIGIDVPPRGLARGPGGWTGADFYAGLHGTQTSGLLVRAPTNLWAARWRSIGRFAVSVHGRTVRFSLSRKTLGNPAWFDFAIATGRELSNETSGGGSDEAPTQGAFTYRLAR